jgi:UbiD family decarboxylase
MGHRSLGEFIAAAEAINDVQVIRGASRELDIGCLTELYAERDGPLLLFEQVQDCLDSVRLASNVTINHRRFALALGFPVDAHPVALVQLVRERLRSLEPFPPRQVATGPVLTHSLPGEEVDIRDYPAPRWHSRDGGRYIGTGDLVVVRDPETGRTNFATYRAMIQGRDRVSLWIINNKGGRIIAEKYWRRGEPCPVALVLGCDPITLSAGLSRGKYEYAGALHGEPVEVVAGPTTGLLIPAHAELVLEGEMPSPDEESAHEGPFGEWPGYYSHSGPEVVVRIKNVTFRDNPIIYGYPPLRPLLSWTMDPIAGAARMWDQLERSGVTDITGVWALCHGLMVVIALRQRYAGHAKQALLTANSIPAGGSMFRYYVAVDEDIDPSNLKDVLWAMCTRVDPAASVDVVRGAWTSDLDPRLTPQQKESGDHTMGRMLIDACKPFPWRAAFPQTNIFSPEERALVLQRWEGILSSLTDRQLVSAP